MNLRFPYLDEPLHGPPPPLLPSTTTLRWRPLVPVTVIGPNGQSFSFGRALVDPGADDTILPLDVVNLLGVALNVRFLGADYRLEVEPNPSFPARAAP